MGMTPTEVPIVAQERSVVTTEGPFTDETGPQRGRTDPREYERRAS